MFCNKKWVWFGLLFSGNAFAVDFQASNLIVLGTTTFNGNLIVGASVQANIFLGDGSQLTNLPSGGGGDNLGSHISTQTLNMQNFMITNVSTITMAGGGIAIVPDGTGGSNSVYGISIGSNSYNNYNAGIGIGKDTYENWTGIGIGEMAYSNYGGGIGIGFGSAQNYDAGIGIGNNFAYGNYGGGIGIGYSAQYNANYGVGIGGNSTSNYMYGVGLGPNTSANHDYGVGIGYLSQNNYNYGVGVGNNSSDNHDYGTSIGAYTTSYSSSASVGAYATALNNEALALGAGAKANAFQSTCIGAYCVNNDSASIKMKGVVIVDSFTMLQIDTKEAILGGIISCSDCSVNYSVCVGSAGVGGWVLMNSAGHCQ